MAESYLSARGYAIADCVTCGDVCPASRDDVAAQRRWASRHADANPGHSAHLTMERTRVYKSAERCERQYPEVGHEDEGYSCSTHNMAWDECPHRPADPTPVRCDYCGDLLPAVKSRAHIPTTPDLQRRGFAADKVVCPECVTNQKPEEPS